MEAALVALQRQLQEELAQLGLAVKAAHIVLQLVHVPFLDAPHGLASGGP